MADAGRLLVPGGQVDRRHRRRRRRRRARRRRPTNGSKGAATTTTSSPNAGTRPAGTSTAPRHAPSGRVRNVSGHMSVVNSARARTGRDHPRNAAAVWRRHPYRPDARRAERPAPGKGPTIAAAQVPGARSTDCLRQALDAGQPAPICAAGRHLAARKPGSSIPTNSPSSRTPGPTAACRCAPISCCASIFWTPWNRLGVFTGLRRRPSAHRRTQTARRRLADRPHRRGRPSRFWRIRDPTTSACRCIRRTSWTN